MWGRRLFIFCAERETGRVEEEEEDRGVIEEDWERFSEVTAEALELVGGLAASSEMSAVSVASVVPKRAGLRVMTPFRPFSSSAFLLLILPSSVLYVAGAVVGMSSVSSREEKIIVVVAEGGIEEGAGVDSSSLRLTSTGFLVLLPVLERTETTCTKLM
jgi:hypothetical protein